MSTHSCPIQSQINSANDTITSLLDRISAMESRLSSPLLPEDKRKEIETELTEIKKLLNTNTELLSKLHKENSKSFILVAIFVFISFLLYGLWAMWYNGVK